MKYCLSLWLILSYALFVSAQEGFSALSFSDTDMDSEVNGSLETSTNENYTTNRPVYFKDSKTTFDISIENQSDTNQFFEHPEKINGINSLVLLTSFGLQFPKSNQVLKNERLDKFSKQISGDSAIAISLNSAQNFAIYSQTTIHRKTNTPIAKLYAAKWKKSRWTNGKKIRFTNRKYAVNHPMLSPDETKLYFSSDMPGGYGGMDLYVVTIKKNGKFSKPKNLGNTINSAADESYPYIIDNYLYFSSNRVSGKGGLDLYESILKQGKHTKAKNMGAPFNSANDDFSFITNATRDFGYFTSNRGQDNKVYAFQLKKKTILPTQVEVTDEIAKTTEMPESSPELESAIQFTTTPSSENNKTKQSLTAKVITAKDIAELNASVQIGIKHESNEEAVFMESTIFYDFNDYSIRESEKQYLDEIIRLLNNNPNAKIRIESHADAVGSKAYNQLLSEMRSETVAHYLISNGLSPEKIDAAIGFGEERLLSKCTKNKDCPDRNRQLDRRTEFVIIFN